jgi:hypothetical protein
MDIQFLQISMCLHSGYAQSKFHISDNKHIIIKHSTR